MFHLKCTKNPVNFSLDNLGSRISEVRIICEVYCKWCEYVDLKTDYELPVVLHSYTPKPPRRGQLLHTRDVNVKVFFYGHNLYSEKMIRTLCMDTTCPENVSQANADNCCVRHANIHICTPIVQVNKRTGFNSLWKANPVKNSPSN